MNTKPLDMNTTIRLTLSRMIYAVLIILLVSCGKDVEIFTPREKTGDFKEFLEKSDIGYEEVIVKADNIILFETKYGSLIEIPSGALLDDSGNLVTGDITLKIKEIYKKHEMVLNNVTTMTDSEYLISERMFDIKVFQEDKPLKLKEGKKFNIYVPDILPEEKMKLFYGEKKGENIIWEEDQAAQRENIAINEWFLQSDNGIYSDFGYVLNCDRFSWINIDRYSDIPDEEKVAICVKLPEEIYSKENTIVFMLIKNENTVVAFNYKEDPNIFCEPYGKTPKGFDICLISISSLGNDEYHFGVLKTTVAEDKTYDLIPEKYTFDQIVEKIKAL